MLTGNVLVQAVGAFGTGVLTSLSPCVYPMMPITLGFLGKQASEGARRNSAKKSVLCFALGQAVALTILGLVAVKLGETLGFSSQSRGVRVGVGLLLLIAAYFSWKGRLPAWVESWNILPKQIHGQSGLLSAFLLGASAALIASPCTSPVLGAVLAVLATEKSQWVGLMLMSFYALGFSAIFLVVGLGAVRLGSLPRSGQWMSFVHKLGTVALFVAGFYYLMPV